MPAKIPKAKGYRRSKGKEVWHYKSTCQFWPMTDYEEIPFGAHVDDYRKCPYCEDPDLLKGIGNL